MQLMDSYEIQESNRHIENGYVIKILTLLFKLHYKVNSLSSQVKFMSKCLQTSQSAYRIV